MKVYFKYKFKLHNEGLLCTEYSERYYDLSVKWKIGRFSISEVWNVKFDIEDENDRDIILEYLENPNNDRLKSRIHKIIQEDVEKIKKEEQEEMEKGYLSPKQRWKLWWMSHGFFKWNSFEIED